MIEGIVWGCLMWAWVGLEVLVALITRTRRGGGDVQDRGSMLMLWAIICASVSLSSWMRYAVPASIHNAGHWLRPLSIALLAAGLVLRLTAIFTLGKSFSANVAILDQQRLLRTGLYSLVRHPSYSGLLLIFLAVGLHGGNWASLAFAVVPTTLVLLYRIHIEEAVLRGAFGSEYVEYSRVTKRLIPGVF